MRRLIGVLLGCVTAASVVTFWTSDADAACVRGVGKRDVLKLRAGPSARTSELAEIPPETCRMRVTGPCHSGWCPVAYDGQQGWARQQFIWMDGRPGPEGQAHARDPTPDGEREQFALMRPGARPLPPSDEPPARPSPPVASAVPAVPPREPPPAVAPRASEPIPAPAPRASEAPQPAVINPSPVPDAAPEAPVAPKYRPDAAPAPKRAEAPAADPKAKAEAASNRCAKGPGNGQRMRVRAAPGAASDALYGIQPGTCGIEITGTCRANWCPVAIGSYRGWVDRRELE